MAHMFPATTVTANVPATTYSNLFSTLMNSTRFNTTSLVPPSPQDLLYLPFRLLRRLDRFLFVDIPRQVLNGRVQEWAVYVGDVIGNLVPADAAVQNMAENAGAIAGQAADQPEIGWGRAVIEALQLSNTRSYWGMLSYITSRWAFTCFSLALILNRVNIYGSTRQRIFLTWDKRLALRIVPIILFALQIRSTLQAIQCQSSPDFSVYRYGNPDRYHPMDWPSDSDSLSWLSSTILGYSTDAESCSANGMSRIDDRRAPYGSFSLLWPTFLRICISHFVESLSCSLQQQPVMTDVGMSVFEHSLAFAEAEAMLANLIGVRLFGGNATHSINNFKSDAMATSITSKAISDATTQLTGPHIFDRLNVPVEVLLIALISCCNGLTAHIIAVFNRQRSLRLINTGFWGLCFMAAFIWGFQSKSTVLSDAAALQRLKASAPANTTFALPEGRLSSGLLHFPTVCIVGFIPHLIILLGITICIGIYLLALVLTALSLESNPCIPHATGIKERFVIAHQNLQAAVQVRGIEIKWHEDFYTALLRIGFAALMAASEAVFLNEGRQVEVRQFTWLEEDRLDEIEASRLHGQAVLGSSTQFQIVEEYGLPKSDTVHSEASRSGYSKERKLERSKKRGDDGDGSTMVYPHPRSGGVDALQRTTRFYLLFIFLRGIYFLLGGWIAYGFGIALDWMGITSRPPWLRAIVGKSLKKAIKERENLGIQKPASSIGFGLLNEDGEIVSVPTRDDFDIEPEMRRRLMTEHDDGDGESMLDEKLYSWWKMGGWWGTVDNSGEYKASTEIEDTTSVISMSSAASTDDEIIIEESHLDAWESESDGQRTPTQYYQSRGLWTLSPSRESTPTLHAIDSPLDSATLARLLNPHTREDRDEARILAAHLSTDSPSTASGSGGITTRARYRAQLERERAHILIAGRRSPQIQSSTSATSTLTPAISSSAHILEPLTATEEAEILESLILSRRGRNTSTSATASSTSSNLSNPSEQASPTAVCVVCQSAPRTIIAWPCRCLCVCEDCRVSLALNNFGSCVTCRRMVGGFVRLWVP